MTKTNQLSSGVPPRSLTLPARSGTSRAAENSSSHRQHPGYTPERRITACIPYYKCRRYLRRAVESLLNQTHRAITVIVVNDSDSDAPWELLDTIKDPRLVRFDLRANHGPYFATAVALGATTAPYFLIQDADDWSDSRRAATLLQHLEDEGSDLAISIEPQFIEDESGLRVTEVRWSGLSKEAVPKEQYVVSRTLGPRYAYRVPHHGLFVAASLRRAGGYFAGLRVGYDTLLTNLILMTGRISHVPLPLYYRLLRPESLTHSRQTGTASAMAASSHRAIVAAYGHCFAWYSKFLAGAIDSRQLGDELRGILARNVTPSDRDQLAAETARLRHVLKLQELERVSAPIQ